MEKREVIDKSRVIVYSNCLKLSSLGVLMMTEKAFRKILLVSPPKEETD
jgi:hypothetical protein